ncbi:MAG TPA: hypothetical protein VKM93_17480, partial [Terriglobia bacterium]|nr:hypothetical protein [Terriglobia bacterium]
HFTPQRCKFRFQSRNLVEPQHANRQRLTSHYVHADMRPAAVIGVLGACTTEPGAPTADWPAPQD